MLMLDVEAILIAMRIRGCGLENLHVMYFCHYISGFDLFCYSELIDFLVIGLCKVMKPLHHCGSYK